MIIQEQVEVRICNKEQIEYYSKLGYQPEWKKVILIIIEHLMVNSNIKIDVICDICGTDKKLNYSKYTKNTKNLTTDYCCSNKCAMTKQENTCLEKYGFKYPAKDKEIYKKTEKTKLEKYGDIHYVNRPKAKKTCLEKYGFESSNKDDNVKEKMKKTLFENYGVYYPTQNDVIFSKSQKNSFKINIYKNTILTYQGSYEKYFLELMECKGLLNDISNGKSYTYFFEKNRKYFSDFLYNNQTIEIKSSWTYNRNGKDKLLELKNETRWQTVRDMGDGIVILMSKEEIKNYIDNIVYNKKVNEI